LFCVVGRGNLLHFRSAIPEKTRTSTRKSLPSVETVIWLPPLLPKELRGRCWFWFLEADFEGTKTATVRSFPTMAADNPIDDDLGGKT
jgi:hypothetical protein